MSRSRFRDLHAVHVQFADTITNQAPTRSATELTHDGHRLLADGLYTEAFRCFTEALTREPGDEEAHFGLALAMLQGRRPHRHRSDTLRRVLAHLRAAPGLVEARLLELLVAEDHGLFWRRSRGHVCAGVAALAARLPADRAEMILRHVPATEARTWQALHGCEAPQESVVVVIGEVGSEARKAGVRRYFQETPDDHDRVFGTRLVQIACIVAAGGVTLLVLDGVVGAVATGIVAVGVLVQGLQVRAAYWRRYAAAEPKPSDAQMDVLLREDVRGASERALQQLGITSDELELHSRDVGPPAGRRSRWPADQGCGAIALFGPARHALGRIGTDQTWRFATYAVMVLCPTGHHLGIYQCELDFVSGRRRDEETHEYHYADVVAVRTTTTATPGLRITVLDPSAHHRIPLGRTLQREFQVIVSSGDRSSIIVGIEDEDEPSEAAHLQESGIDLVIDAVRRMLREKKGGAAPAL